MSAEPGYMLTATYIQERAGGTRGQTAGPGVRRIHSNIVAVDRMAKAMGCTVASTPTGGNRLVCPICGPEAPVGLCDKDKHDAYYEAIERGGLDR